MSAVPERRTETSDGLDLRQWLRKADDIGEVRRIDAEIDPIEEAAGLAYLVGRREGSEALLFTNVRGAAAGTRLLFNAIGSSRARCALAMGCESDADLAQIITEFREKLKRRIAPRVVPRSSAPVLERSLVGDEVDLRELAAPKHWPLDGGRYLGTADIVVTRNPDNGRVNVGTYRVMVHGPRHLGLYMSPGKDGAADIAKQWQRGNVADVVVVVGIHPLGVIAGSQGFPKDVSEYDAMGGILGAPVPVIETEAGLVFPRDAEVVIEGRVHADEKRSEGPFGEFTGYYGRPPGDSPVIEVTAMHCREDPIVTAALMADYPSCEQALFFAVAKSARVWDDLERLGIPGIAGVWCPPAAAGGAGMVVVSLQQAHVGHSAQVLALASQLPSAAYFTKWIVVVDDDVDATDMQSVLWAMTTRCNPETDIEFLRNTWSTWLDPAKNPPSERPWGSKCLVNACKDYRYIDSFAKRTTLRREVWDQLAERWSRDFGLPGSIPELRTYETDASD